MTSCSACGRDNCKHGAFDRDEANAAMRLAIAMVVVTLLFMAIVVWLAT